MDTTNLQELQEKLEEQASTINTQSRIKSRYKKDLVKAGVAMQSIQSLNAQLEQFLHLLPLGEQQKYKEEKEKIENTVSYLTQEYGHNSMHRNMVRVTAVEKDYVKVCIPSWSPNEEITLYKHNLPEELVKQMVLNFRCYAYIPLADYVEEIFFEDWEYIENGERIKVKKTFLK